MTKFSLKQAGKQANMIIFQNPIHYTSEVFLVESCLTNRIVIKFF